MCTRGVRCGCACDRYYPLHYACGEGHLQLTEFLLKSAGANTSRKNMDGLSPLMCAVQQGHVPVVKVSLLRHDRGACMCSEARLQGHPTPKP